MNSSLSTATGAPIFAQPTILFVSVIALLLIFLIAAFVSVVGQGWPTTGKAQKFCPWPIVAWAPLWVLE